MIEFLLAVLRFAGVQLGGALDAAVPTVGLLAILVLAVAVVAVAAVLVTVPRSRAVGDRAPGHAILLATLPASSHPDAAGHPRSRAPGSLPSVA